MAVTILTGTNHFQLRAAVGLIIADFEAEQGDMALERLDGETATYERIQEAVQSLPFLASRKLVVLQQPGANKQFLERAAALLSELPETTDLVIIEPKLDKRQTYYKFLKKQKAFREFAELDENSLAKWLVTEASSKGAELSLADAHYLAERTAGNQQTLASEIEKLSLYTKTINRTVINQLTAAAPQSSIFQLLEAIFAGNLRRGMELYREQRALKVEPQQIIAMLTWQLHVLALVKAAGHGRTPESIAADAKINPYVVRKSESIARDLTVARLRQMIAELVTIDERLKRESVDADNMLLEYLVNLSR